jgi:hypothetical protein
MAMKRCAIVGTAATWRKTPWSDPGLTIVSLNDAYAMGLPRVDEWYELHPLDKLVFRKMEEKVIHADRIPPGYYIRPEGHVEWLKTQAQTIPVWLQQEPPDDWPVNAARMPIEALEAKYGTYWASGPSFMLMHLYERGFREFQIYGIHLATDYEYREQRPNFEYLMGCLLGPQRTMTTANGLRTYVGNDVTIVLPVDCPLLTHGWKYAYEPKPKPEAMPEHQELKAVRKEKDQLIKALVGPLPVKERQRAYARLQRLEIIEMDIDNILLRRAQRGTLVASLAA